MAPPPWVAGVLAAVLLLIAGYCASRLAVARWRRRSTDHGVDVMHAVMGVAMAGMLVPRLNPLQSRAWAVLFAAGAAWFGWQLLRDRRARGPAPAGSAGGVTVPSVTASRGPVPGAPAPGSPAPSSPAPGSPALAYAPGGHHGAHVLSCAAMVCMLLAAPGLGVPVTAGRGAVPVVALVLAVAVAASVVVSTDRISALRPAPATPAAVRGPAPAGGGPALGGPAGGALARGTPPPALARAARPAPAPGCARPALSPRLAACCQIVMGVAMAYMLILML